jgi:hypothetical protein
MQSDDVPPVKCPLCGHTACEVLEVGSDPEIALSNARHPPRPKVSARCPNCAVEFQVTNVAK